MSRQCKLVRSHEHTILALVRNQNDCNAHCIAFLVTDATSIAFWCWLNQVSGDGSLQWCASWCEVAFVSSDHGFKPDEAELHCDCAIAETEWVDFVDSVVVHLHDFVLKASLRSMWLLGWISSNLSFYAMLLFIVFIGFLSFWIEWSLT